MSIILNNTMRYLIPFIVLMISAYSYAQPTNFTRNGMWKYNKKEWFIGGGATDFLTDLGGLNRVVLAIAQ